MNVARGSILDYDAVMAELQSGHLGGLAMDVAWSEPIDPSDPILQFPNVLITPHVASLTGSTYDNMAEVRAYQCSLLNQSYDGDAVLLKRLKPSFDDGLQFVIGSIIADRS